MEWQCAKYRKLEQSKEKNIDSCIGSRKDLSMKVFINGFSLGLCANFSSRFAETNVVMIPPVLVADLNSFNSRLAVNRK
jgi:hypothetical protein